MGNFNWGHVYVTTSFLVCAVYICSFVLEFLFISIGKWASKFGQFSKPNISTNSAYERYPDGAGDFLYKMMFILEV